MASRYRVDLLQEELDKLCKQTDGITEAVIVSLDGFVVASYPPYNYQDDEIHTTTTTIAATASSVISQSQSMLERLDRGSCERLIVEGVNGAMIVHPIDSTDAALVVMVNKEVKIGLASLAMRNSTATLAKILVGGNKH